MTDLSGIDAQTQEIVSLYRGGMGLGGIAKQVNRSKQTVKARLQKLGVYEGDKHATRQASFFSRFDTWGQRGVIGVNPMLNGSTILTFGQWGELSCRLPNEAHGKRASLAFHIRSWEGTARVVFGFRHADGQKEQVAELFVPVTGIDCFLRSVQAIGEESEFYLDANSLSGSQFSLSPLTLETSPPPCDPPDLELTRWTCEHGATAEATRKGWRISFPTEESALTVSFPWEENRLAFSALSYLIAPHAGVLCCTIRDTAGREESRQDLQWTDTGFTLECRKRYCVGPVSLALSGASPHYLDEGITLLLRNLKVSGREREFSLALPEVSP